MEQNVNEKKSPRKSRKLILIAAIWIAAIPVLGKYVILGVSGLLIFTISTNFLTLPSKLPP